MRSRLAVLLAVLLAGCSGFTSPGGVAGSPTETLTPVSVPERTTPIGGGTPTTPTPTPEDRIVAGLTEQTVTDPFALADVHRRTLSNTSYTKFRHTRLAGANETLRETERSIAVAPGARRYHLIETSQSNPAYPVSSITPRLELWYDDGPAVFRLDSGENVTYRVGTTSSLEGPVGDVSGHDRLAGLYATVERWSIQRVETPNGTRLVLESREAPAVDTLGLPILVTDPSNPQLRIVLTPEGRVVSHTLRYDAQFNDRPVTVVRRVQFLEVGHTTVDEPAWLEEALSETTDDRRGDG